MKDLISNAAIIMVFMFLTGEIFKNNWLKFSTAIKINMFIGFTAGVMGCLLMTFSFQLPQNVILDLRQFAVILSAIHGGFFAAVIAGFMMAAFRFLYFTASYSAAVGVGEIIVVSLLCGLIGQSRLNHKEKWCFMNLTSIIIVSMTLGVLIDNKKLLVSTLLFIWLMSAAMGYIVFYFSNYIKTSNKLYKKYKLESTKDFLTGLNNVRHFNRELKSIVNESIQKHEKISMLMLDIDYFKKVNDTYGHLAGDEILKELALVLSHSSRNIDSISRVGGEEFCVILPNCSKNEAMEVAERIRKAVERSWFKLLDGNKIHITVSVGVANFPDTVSSAEDMIEEVDKALYVSKKSGRNRVSLNI